MDVEQQESTANPPESEESNSYYYNVAIATLPLVEVTLYTASFYAMTICGVCVVYGGLYLYAVDGASQCQPPVLHNFVVVFYVVVLGGMAVKLIADVYVACTVPGAVIEYEASRVAAAVSSGNLFISVAASFVDSTYSLVYLPVMCCLAMYATWVGYGNVVCPAQQGTALFVWSRYAVVYCALYVFLTSYTYWRSASAWRAWAAQYDAERVASGAVIPTRDTEPAPEVSCNPHVVKALTPLLSVPTALLMGLLIYGMYTGIRTVVMYLVHGQHQCGGHNPLHTFGLVYFLGPIAAYYVSKGVAAIEAHATKSREQQAYEAARAAAAHEDPEASDIAITVGSGWDRMLQVVYAYGVAVYGFYTLYGDPALCPEAKGAPFYALMRVLVWAYVVVPTGDVIMYVRARARAREWTHNYDVAQASNGVEMPWMPVKPVATSEAATAGAYGTA